MDLFAIWDETFKTLSKTVVNIETLYLAGESALVSLILEQLTKASREQCLEIFENVPFFQRAYKKVFAGEGEVGNLLSTIGPALGKTRQALQQAGFEILPVTFLGIFFERFGIIGEKQRKNSGRNETGSFYTPAAIAQFIVQRTFELGSYADSIEKVQCLDPACGGGIFLLALAETLLRYEMERNAKDPDAKVARIRHILTHQVWGIDLSPDALRVSQLQLILWALSFAPEIKIEEICSWVGHCTQGDFLSAACEGMTPFSVIVGNPPFGNLLSETQKEAAKGWATTRTREISELFLERALNILDAGGCLGFVMPKTMAYYAQWERARGLVLPTMLAGVADLGLSFPGVNFETFALFAKNNPADEKSNQLPIFDLKRGLIGTFPRQYISETALIPLQPLVPEEETYLETIRVNSVPVSRLAQTREVTRGIYLSEEVKSGCKAGDCLWINRVPDIQHYAIKRLWAVDPSVISQANPSRIKALQNPKVLVKVLRGRKLSSIPDPWGILMPTEKLVSILPDKCSPREILAWSACLNSWPASYYLQKVIFSGTTESARVLDYPYLKHVPMLLHTSRAVNVLSGIQLALLLATQIQTQMPPLLPPTAVPSIGLLFQQVIFLIYSGEVPNDPPLSLEDDFDPYLQLWRDFLITSALKSPVGGLSRVNLANFDKNQELPNEKNRLLENSAQNFARELNRLLSQNMIQKYDPIVKRNPQWHQLVQYFNSKF